MQYIKTANEIIITNTEEFNIVQILDCGQIFRYSINGNEAVVYSKDKMAKVLTEQNCVKILTSDVEYFERFFDLSTNYTEIKNKLKKDKFLKLAVDFGYGIRILNNDCFEMIVSFIISANNNIGRIKKSLNFLAENFGTNMGKYFAFPTLEQLKKATVEDYRKAGLGYRAEHMFYTIQNLTNQQIENLKTLTKTEQFNFLVSLKGVGEKVANCILLFGLGAKDVFPVDTWINKVYNVLTNSNNTNRAKITKELTERYGNLSGYAQQYFYYYFRENKIM